MSSSEQPSIPGSLIASPTTQTLITANKSRLTVSKPEEMSEEQDAGLQQAARNIVTMYAQSPSDLRVTQSVGRIGSISSFSATQKTQLIGVRLKPLLEAAAAEGGPIPDGLAKMRTQVEKINPAKMMSRLDQGWIGAFISRISNPMKRILQNISVEYSSVEETINTIVTGLLDAKTGLDADNAELSTMVCEVEECLHNIRADAYQSELVYDGISQFSIPTNPVAARNREDILQRLISRIQDLRTMETVLLQMSLETRSIYTGNNDLADTISRAATITRAILTVGMVNAVALHKQKATIGVVQANREYNNQLVQSLADAAGMGAVAVAKLMADPALTFGALTKSHATLVSALDKADSIKRDRMKTALENMPVLGRMAAELEDRSKRLSANPDGSQPQIEGVS